MTLNMDTFHSVQSTKNIMATENNAWRSVTVSKVAKVALPHAVPVELY